MSAALSLVGGFLVGFGLLHFGFRRPWLRVRRAPDQLAGRVVPLTGGFHGSAGESPHGGLVLDFGAVRAAVERAELRRRGVHALAPRDPQREALEDRLLEHLEAARAERATSRELYPTSTRDVVALPIKSKTPEPHTRPGA